MLGYIDPGTGSQIGAAVFAVIAIVVYVVPVVLIARWAARKGSTFGGFVVLGLLTSPIISFIVALVIEDKREPRQVVVAQGPGRGGHLDELQKITDLRNAGTLSQEEFETEKARILGA